MVDRNHLGFRREMRSAMVRYGERRYTAFAAHTTKAFIASPRSFLARFNRQNSDIAKVGISPSLFRAQSASLWPNS
jgi:hypothetical protein